MSSIIKLYFIFQLFFFSYIKTEELLPEEIGEVDYIEIIPNDPQNFEFSYYKFIDESSEYQQVYSEDLEGCKLPKNKQNQVIRYQLNNDQSQILLEGEQQISSDQFLIKIPLINVIKKNLFLKPFCSENQIDLYIYNFDHDSNRSLRIIKLNKVMHKFKKNLFQGYRYILLNVDLNNGDVEEIQNLNKSIICQPQNEIEFKEPFKFEFFMIEGNGEITSRIKKDIIPNNNMNFVPSFINSLENLIPFCFQQKYNNNYKVVLRNQKSKKLGNEHEDHSLFQMQIKTDGNNVNGTVYKLDDTNKSTIVTNCQLEVDYLDQFPIIELKYIVLKAKKLYTEFSEIKKINTEDDVQDLTYIGTEYFNNFNKELYDCKIHFTKKESENKAFGFLFYKEIINDIDEYIQEEKDQQIEKVNYDELIESVNQHIKNNIQDQIDTEKVLDIEEERLSKAGLFNDLMDEFSDELNSEKESESVQIDDEALEAEIIKEVDEQKKRMSIINTSQNQNLQDNKNSFGVKRIQKYEMSDNSNEGSSDGIQLGNKNSKAKREITNIEPFVITKRNDLGYYKRANVSSNSSEENAQQISLFGNKYKNPMQRARQHSIEQIFNNKLPQKDQRVSNLQRDSITKRSKPVLPKIHTQQNKIIQREQEKDMSSPFNITFKPHLGYRKNELDVLKQKQQKYFKNQIQEKDEQRDSFNITQYEPQIANERKTKPIQMRQMNFHKKKNVSKEIVINLNEIMEDDKQNVSRDFIRQKIQQLKNNLNNERQFRENRFKTINRSREQIFNTIGEKIKEKYQSIRRDFVNQPFQKPQMNQVNNKVQTNKKLLNKLQKNFEPISREFYSVHIENNQLLIRQNSNQKIDEELINYNCQPFIQQQVPYLQNLDKYNLNELQIQWINESRIFKRNLQWIRNKDELIGNWQDSQRFLETELLLKFRLGLQNQSCVYKINKKNIEVLFIKNYINATKHEIYQDENILHYTMKNYHTNTIIQKCQEQIIGLEKLPVIRSYQTDQYGFTKENKYNLFFNNGKFKSFITENISNQIIVNQNSFCVIDKSNYKFKSRVALRTFIKPISENFQFVEAYFFNYEVAIFEVHYNSIPYHKTTYYNFEEKLQSADLETLFFMVNTFVNQNIVSQTNLVNKGYRIRLPYLRLKKNEPKRNVHVQVNTSKNNYFAFIYLKPQAQDIQVFRTALYLSSNQQLNYLLVNDHNQNIVKVEIDKENEQNQTVKTRQINNEFFQYTNKLVVLGTRQSPQKQFNLHQEPIQLKEGFYMETFFIKNLPDNNRFILKDAKVNMISSKITIVQNIFTMKLI